MVRAVKRCLVPREADGLERDALRILRFLGQRGTWDGDIIFVDARAMRALNRRFRHTDSTTTVLSFSGNGFVGGSGRYLGQIVLCPSEIRRREGRGDRRLQLISYLAHGILHCIGYDHTRPNNRCRMERRERDIMHFLFHTL
jgi:probable rRNA maturation factor